MRFALGPGSSVLILGRPDFGAAAGRITVSVGIGILLAIEHEICAMWSRTAKQDEFLASKNSPGERGTRLVASEKIGPNVRRKNCQVATRTGQVIQPARRSAVGDKTS